MGSTKQSRATLAPLAQYEGSDKAVPLREHLDISMPAYNKLIAAKSLEREGESAIPVRPITSADMQGTKALYGMCQSSHSVWCLCRKGVGGQQHAYKPTAVASYDEMIEYCVEIDCKMKTFDDMCALAHYSPGVARGLAFTFFACPACGFSPSEEEWRAELREHECLSDAERALA
eukprot:3564735-Pleurochrysis_carterae.AAC.1